MSLRDQLQTIYDQHNRLTPQLVVDEARPDDHPLHNRFEWDDEIAGEAWRRHQAHELIRSVKIVRKDDSGREYPKVRAFHALRLDDGISYEPLDSIIDNEFQVRLLLSDMRREWRTLKARYDQFHEFWQIVKGDVQKQDEAQAAD